MLYCLHEKAMKNSDAAIFIEQINSDIEKGTQAYTLLLL
jgi:hypothetical protein